VTVQVVVFDVGETLVDEAGTYARWEADGVTVPRAFEDRDLHADALEEFLRNHVDFVGSSERWGVEKPATGFFKRVVEEAGAPAGDVLYVGDRVDNDVVPALAAGLRAVRIRRGAHAEVESPAGTITIDSLADLPEALARV
jgi:FMN phosphatase YigB (HAD superfamily)